MLELKYSKLPDAIMYGQEGDDGHGRPREIGKLAIP